MGLRTTLLKHAGGGFASVAIAGTLFFALPYTSAFAEYHGFPDLSEDHWAVQNGIVDWSSEHHAINGFPDGTWGPDLTMDRAQAAQVIYNMAGSPELEGTAEQFTDVSDDDFCATAALWCREQGIFTGIDGTDDFDPWSPITREQVAKILCEYAEGAEGEASAYASFPDADEVSTWAEGFVSWAVSEDVITGYETTSDAYLNALDDCTRAEFVTMLARTVDGYMSDEDIAGKTYVVDATYEPNYVEVETPVYEEQWVADTYTGTCYRYYCRWCGYDADGKCIIPLTRTNSSNPNSIYYGDLDAWLSSVWQGYYEDVLWHVQRNDCNCPADVKIDPEGAFDGSTGVSRGTGGPQVLYTTVELETGHYEQVQTGTTTELVDAGGSWTYSNGRWE